MTQCIFCRIINKEVLAHIVYEDRNSIAFLDVNPAAMGHTLVAPKKHFFDIKEIDGKELNHVMLTVKKVSEALLKFNEGINIIQNNGLIAGQIVNHIHFHLVPRNKNDGIRWNRPSLKLNDNEIVGITNKIKSLLKP